ncbi:glycosyltransferase [Mucilaginibacter phyllosphaerae]|uniref:Glycosyltransferase family 4 protein n=1 Tax=Mucilaginibacter phyllosphaerae TaxID=1812349 RepID=A0A4Y8AHR4_9SPHI|nr:glycosyltransferase [Mucilaginibacter phyllosphaerae]MBB3968557.1 glycosyltransferase involved in cell wall biosynthesis [Mucilaginibacter phyllosphaerae]TEW67802.1 glycosyltransferase family 4 protein [Mucilaginibacter phyllosphaerae]GGH15252.1 glycosyl transferase [Mucilaginibacter phyllosphaerae]
MRILLIMDPGIPVPPEAYGGHERLVYLFAEEYQKLGHQVTLLAGPDSHCSGTTVAFGVNNLNRSVLQKNKEVIFAWQYLYRNLHNFDLVHNFGRLIYLLPVLNSPVKKIMTYGRPVSTKGIRLLVKLPHKNLIFSACSDYCVSTGNVAGHWETVYNTIDFSKYQLNQHIAEDAPLMFLGRLDKIKGAHTAIKVAKATHHKLILAGNIPTTPDNLHYYKTEIEPLIDNDRITYVGALNDREKNTYLQQAKALLFPIEWDEPFGMVMIEAMACGTPVIAFKRGSVPEVVQEGINGFVVKDASAMAAKLAVISAIDRKQCRESAKQRFDVDIIAKQYLSLFNG